MLNLNFTRKELILLTILILFGLSLRTLFFSHVTFGYDQARDAFQSISIIKYRDIKIMGPTTDIKGLFHGPLFWYIISPWYYLSGGDPRIARVPMILINLLNIPFIYYFVRKLFRNRIIAGISALFFTVSFETIEVNC